MKKALSVAIVCLTILLFGSLLTMNVRTAEAASEVSILSHDSYVDSYGWLHVVGEVQNTGTGPLEFVKIVATFYNSSNTVVGTSFTYSALDKLNVGEKSPFEILFTEKTQVPKVDHYTLTTDALTTIALPPALTIPSSSSYTDIYGWMHVVGQIQNNGTATATYVKVVATFYDSEGKVILTEFTYTDPDAIDCGNTAPFEILVTEEDRVPMVASYSLNAQSDEYSLVPEWSTTIVLIMLPLLAGAVLFVRKRFID